MKSLLPAFLTTLFLLTFSNVWGQITFTKGAILDKSYASSTMVAKPVLGKSNDGFFILSSGLMSAKRIVQMNLDKNMNQVGEEVIVKLPKGKTVRRIFNVDHKMIVVLWTGKKSSPFECYAYDAANSTLGNLLLTIPVDDYPGREELDISLLNKEFDNFLGFSIRPKQEYAHTYRKIAVTDRSVTKLIWSQVITDPYVQEAELMGEFKLTDLYFNDETTIVARFSRPFLQERKEEVQTEMYHFDGAKMDHVWHDQVIRSTEQKDLFSLPLPYLSKTGRVEVYNLSCDKEQGNFHLVKFDIRGDEIERFSLSAGMDDLPNVKRIGIYGLMMPVNQDFENGSFCFLISEQLNQLELSYGDQRKSMKHYVVSFHLSEEGVTRDNIIDVGWPEAIWGELDDKVIFSNSLDVIIKGKMTHANQKEVFDQFELKAKKTQSGITYHYLLDDELYSMHSEYGTGNMSSQLVKWNFN